MVGKTSVGKNGYTLDDHDDDVDDDCDHDDDDGNLSLAVLNQLPNLRRSSRTARESGQMTIS